MHRRDKHVLGKASLVLLSLILASVLAEMGLRLAASASPALEYRLSRHRDKHVEDERLGRRPHPHHPEHDELGFRNESVPERTCILALGDSQTYGHKVRPFEAWPQTLSRLAEVPVYNAAFGGYGPTHALLLWKETAPLEPRLVIFGLYFGNDFYDAYHHVHVRGQLPKLRRNHSALEAAMRQEGAEIDFGPDTAGAWLEDDHHGPIRFWLAERSKLYGVLRQAKRTWLARRSRERENPYFATDWSLVRRLSADREGLLIFDAPPHRTVFTPHQRLLALNLSDPRIEEGHRLALEAIDRLAREVRRAGAEMAVLFLPSKELVFENIYRERVPALSPEMLRQTEAELAWRARTRERLAELRIPVLDPLPALRRALAEGLSPYPLSANSHKNELGHRVVAEHAFQALASRFPDVLRECR